MPRGASITAEVVCFFRAIETLRPAPARVLHDPFARHFLSPAWKLAADAPLTRRVLATRSPLTDLGTLGLQRFVAARHRFIDDALLDFLAAGGKQVVVLGAGFDARALRFVEALGERPLFEVDFPATQRRKRKLLGRAASAGHLDDIGRDAADRIRWLPIDFEQTTLEDGLLRGPFSPDLETFYIWEGVSMYLRPSTVEATLETLARISAGGSQLALDLWSPPTARHPIAALRRSGARMLAMLGEPLHFSLQPADAHAFFGDRGYRVMDLLDAAGLARRYGLVESAIFSDICVARLALD